MHDRNGDAYQIQADPITIKVIGSATPTPTYSDAADVTGDEITLNGNNHVDKLGTFAILAIVLVVLILGGRRRTAHIVAQRPPSKERRGP